VPLLFCSFVVFLFRPAESRAEIGVDVFDLSSAQKGLLWSKKLRSGAKRNGAILTLIEFGRTAIFFRTARCEKILLIGINFFNASLPGLF